MVFRGMSPKNKPEIGRLEFSSEILARLGEELNASVEHGIVELVRNSYDADARTCTVALVNTGVAGGSITVTDNGNGMTSEDIHSKWLVLGRSSKNRTLTRLGRVPVGNKGLGRLAALRLGRVAELNTRHEDAPESVHSVTLEWSKFDRANVVGKVAVEIVPRHVPGATKGTTVQLWSLRDKVGRMAVKRLARALLLLADPFDDDPNSFRPTLEAPEFSDLEGLVEARYFGEAEYRLTARIDAHGMASAELRDWRGLVLFEASHRAIARKRHQSGYACPETSFGLWAFLMTGKAFSTRNATLGEVRKWLRHFGGVHLYQDGIRVSPYGDPGNDWLDMNLARARDPELRPSTNTSIGRLRVQGDDELLVQKTDRTGYIETAAFRALREFAQDALDWMQDRRLEIREARRATARERTKEETGEATRDVRAVINGLPSTSDRSALQVVFNKYERARRRQISRLNEEVQLYRTLATAGIAAATFAHESDGGSLKRVSMSVNAIERRCKELLAEESYATDIQKPVTRIRTAVAGLGVLGEVTLRLVEHQKRRTGKVEVHAVIVDVFKTYRPFLRTRRIAFELELAKGSPFLLGSEAAVESILTNLLNNSAVAFEGIKRRRRTVRVRTTIDEQLVMMLEFMDNGTGIVDISLADIWLPGKTTRKSGTGLGLTIVRDAVTDLSGDIEVEPSGELGGATIRIILPLQGLEDA